MRGVLDEEVPVTGTAPAHRDAPVLEDHHEELAVRGHDTGHVPHSQRLAVLVAHAEPALLLVVIVELAQRAIHPLGA